MQIILLCANNCQKFYSKVSGDGGGCGAVVMVVA